MPVVNTTSNSRRFFGQKAARLRKLTITCLATYGLLCLVSGPLFRVFLHPLLFKAAVVRQIYSSDGSAMAQVEVTKGGFGVWTTRVYMGAPSQSRWIVYQTRDSDFVPELQWLGRRTLLVELPCDRFGHLSNPDEWQAGEPRPDRFRVRFRYSNTCR
jgi:hypothetical protein